MCYDITRQFCQPGEVLQQHVVNVAMKDGALFRVDAAVYSFASVPSWSGGSSISPGRHSYKTGI